MKKIKVTIFAAVAILAGCNKHVIEEPGDMGSISLTLSYEGEYATKVDVPQVNVDDFKVKLERPSDDWEKVFTYAELKQQIEENGTFPLLPGNYDIVAYSPSIEPAAWEQPIFRGNSSFSVEVGKVTSVALTCTLQNMMVTIEVTDAFSNELVDYDVTVDNGSGTLVWKKAEVEAGKAGFFTVAPLKIHVNGLRTATSQPTVYDGQITNVAAKDHHIIKLDAVNTGALEGLEIKVDYSTNPIWSNFEVPGIEWEPVPSDPDQPDPDDGGTTPPVNPEEPSAIRLTWEGNPELDLSPRPVENEMDVRLSLAVDNGIKDFRVRIKSDDAAFIALVAQMVSADYVEYDGVDKSVIKSVTIDMVNDVNDPYKGASSFSQLLKMPYGNELVGLNSVPLDMSGLVPLIATQAASGTYHYFTLEVTDSKNVTESWTLTFYVQ